MITELAELATAGRRLAIDTEFVSERRYQALLCLAQVAVPDPDAPSGVRTEVLDPLEQELDTAPLARVLAEPEIEIVVHAGRQDVAILRRTWGTEVTNVFDTQVAAGFLGFGNQEGYESLVRKVLDVKLRGQRGIHALGPPPADRATARVRRRRRPAAARAGRELERRLAERGRLAVGARGMPRARALERRAQRRSALYERLPRARAV